MPSQFILTLICCLISVTSFSQHFDLPSDTPPPSFVHKLDSLHKTIPDSCLLHRELADAYFQRYEVYFNVGVEDTASDLDILEIMKYHADMAMLHNCADDSTYFIAGYFELVRFDDKEAARPNLEKCLTLNPAFTRAHYDLSIALVGGNEYDYEDAVTHAQSALALATDPGYRHMAALRIAELYTDMEQYDKAIHYVDTALAIEPGEWRGLLERLKLFVLSDDPRTNEAAEVFYTRLGLNNLYGFFEMRDAYAARDREEDLVKFLLAKIDALPKDEYDSIARLHYYIGMVYYDTDYKKAIEYFSQSKKIYRRIYPDDHEKVVESQRMVEAAESQDPKKQRTIVFETD